MAEDAVEAEAVSVIWYSQCLGLVNSVFVGVGGNGFVKVLCVLSQWCVFFFFYLYPVCKTRVAHGTNSHEVS